MTRRGLKRGQEIVNEIERLDKMLHSICNDGIIIRTRGFKSYEIPHVSVVQQELIALIKKDIERLSKELEGL